MPDPRTILDPLPVPRSVKADAYDAFTNSVSADDLKSRLDKLPLANSTKADLWDAKQASSPNAASLPDGNFAPSGDDGGWLLHNPVSNFLAGVGSTIPATAVGAYNLARKIPGVDKVLPAPNAYVQALTEPPEGIAGKVGQVAGNVAQFIAPVGEAVEGANAASKALNFGRVASTAAKVAAETAAATGMTAIQSGGDPDAMKSTAEWSAILGAAGATLPPAVKAIYSSTVKKAISDAPRPLSEAAQNIAQRYGAPLTQGMLGGSRRIQALERALGAGPAAGDLWEPIVQQGQQALNKGAQDLAGNFATDPLAASDATKQALLDQAGQHTAAAQQGYQAMQDIEANPANQRAVQVGTKQVQAPAGSILGADGAPATPGSTQVVPVMENQGLPIDNRGMKAALAPIVDEIQQRMTPAQRYADPGLNAMKNIIGMRDFEPASVSEKNLSYLKAALRNTQMSGESSRLVNIAIDNYEGAIQNGVSQAAEPDAMQTLLDARSNWKSKMDIEGMVQDLGGNDATGTGATRLAQTLLQPSDASYPALQKVLAVAPGAAQDLGQAYLTGRVFKSIAQDGSDFTNPGQAQNLWNQLGPRTKAALYTPEQISDMNGFLELGKRLNENPNSSNSGYVLNALRTAGAFLSSPLSTIGRNLINRNVAKLLYYPEGMATLRATVANAGTPEGAEAAQAVKAIIDGTAPPPPAPPGARVEPAATPTPATAPISPQPPAATATPTAGLRYVGRTTGNEMPAGTGGQYGSGFSIFEAPINRVSPIEDISQMPDKMADAKRYASMLRGGSEAPPMWGHLDPNTGQISVEGARRLMAAQAAGQQTVKVVIPELSNFDRGIFGSERGSFSLNPKPSAGTPVPSTEAGASPIIGEANATSTQTPEAAAGGEPPAASAQAPGSNAVAGTPAADDGRGGVPPSRTTVDPRAAGPKDRSQTSVYVPGLNSVEYPARYEVVERNTVRASHNAQNFQPNPQYGAEYPEGLANERDYTDPLNYGQVAENSTKDAFRPRYHVTDNPDAVNGPPVIDPRSNVLGGNSRAMMLHRAYDADPGSGFGYKQYLIDEAEHYGISPDQVAAMDEPMLVRRLDTANMSQSQNADAVSNLNRVGTKSLTPSERAIAEDGSRHRAWTQLVNGWSNSGRMRPSPRR